MSKVRTRDAKRTVNGDDYGALFAYAEQWLKLQDAAVGGMLASVEPLAATWWKDVNGAADEWTRLYFDSLESTLAQVRAVGDAVARNQQRLLDELHLR